MFDTANILGVGVSAINMQMALDTIDRWIQRRERHYICLTGVHGIIESYRLEAVRAIHNSAGLVAPDGMPLVWLSRLMGFRHVERVYGPDLFLKVCEQSLTHSYRHYFYGGAAGIGERLASRLASRFPGLVIVGVHSPPFRVVSIEEDQAVIKQINEARPDIVWVGISTPKQEQWMAQHVNQLCASVLLGVGAAFDFHAGVKKQAPRWMMRAGLEWLFRLMLEPRRLGKRYLINNPLFVVLMTLQMLGRRPPAIRSSAPT
jgi:N-acetylglucosaminyldiphosphoundecaprenol N-acetyl-beta-D-mannosaminyltransferase